MRQGLFFFVFFVLLISETKSHWDTTYFNPWYNTINIYSFANGGGYLFCGGTQATTTTSYYYLYRSSNGGANWYSIGNSFGNRINALLYSTSGKLFVGIESSGVYKSIDGGSNFLKILEKPTNSLIQIDTTIIAGANTYGIYISSNGGDNWTNIQFNPNASVYALCTDGSNVYAGTGGTGEKGIFKSTNSGQNWRQLYLVSSKVNSLAASGNYVCAGTAGNGIFLSSNKGVNWSPISVDTVSSLYMSGRDIIAGTNARGILISTNYGDNWTTNDTGMNYIRTINALMLYNNILFAGTKGSGVFKAPWDWVNPVKLESFGYSVKGNDVELKWITGYEINNEGFYIERKKENETHWRKGGFVKGKNMPGEYRYIDGGIQAGRYEYRLMQKDFNGNIEYHYLKQIVEILLPQKYFISQNYPNPFNPETKIEYNLPIATNIAIKLYDLAGREVSMIESGYREAGYYSLVFNAKELAGGIYFYRLQAGDYTMVRKMILIK